MNDRSILSASTGNARRACSEDWPVPKSSMCSRTPSGVQVGHDLPGGFGVGHDHRLGDLQDQARGRDPVAGERLRDGADQVSGQNSRCERFTETDRSPSYVLRHSAICGTPCPSIHCPSATIVPVSAMTGRKSPGQQQARARGAPSGPAPRTESAGRRRGRRPAGSARRTAPRSARSQLALGPQPRVGAVVHRRVEDACGAALGLLGASTSRCPRRAARPRRRCSRSRTSRCRRSR